MTGLRKQKQYDWKDSNLALFGSDTDRGVKKESAETEPAWKKAGEKVGLQIWRIVQFKVKPWPQSEYGKFFSGDSYIILNTYTDGFSDELLYDVHFWIGKYSTQDEYGTAAYKTVELDTLLDDKPIQHREVQGHESKLFRSYFKAITLLEGGADSGFRTVKPEEYDPRLLHFSGDRDGVRVKEVARRRDSLDSGDVYILDLGLMIYQWNGKGSNKDERMKAMQYLISLKDERGGKCKSETLDEGVSGAEPEDESRFYRNLNATDKEEVSELEKGPSNKEKELYRLSDASGSIKFGLEKKGSVKKNDLDSKDVFILDTKDDVIVWIGKRTSQSEQKNAMVYAHNYLMKTDHPLLPIVCLREGMKSGLLESALAA